MMREAVRFRDEACARRSGQSESEVGDADGEDGSEGVDAEAGRGPCEVGDGGIGGGGSRGGGGKSGPVGRTSGVDRRRRRDRGVDGRRRVGNAGGRSARESYRVDAVDGRGNIDSGVIILRGREGEERKERDEEGLEERAHLGQQTEGVEEAK